MVIEKALLIATKELKEGFEPDSARLDAEVILADVLKLERIGLVVNRSEPILEDKQVEYFKKIALRKAGEPVAYLISHKEFMGINFMLNKNVLIPRADTEVLVEEVLSFIGDKELSVLDIGTGSGAISVSIAKYAKNARITAVDVSKEALECARNNARLNQVADKITFLELDILKDSSRIMDGFDVIVSNPPYIKTKEIKKLMKSVKDYEPRLALDGGEDGLDFYRTIIKFASVKLSDRGLLAFEIGHDQSREVESLIIDAGEFYNIKFERDLAGIKRVLTATKKEKVFDY